jgi:hydrogenase maturation factor
MPQLGKERNEFMEKVVYSSLGRSSSSVIVGPGKGLDNGVISLGEGRVMILTVDPVSAIPAFGMRLSAWLSVHLIASDYTAAGVDPDFVIFSYNFPPSMNAASREEYVRAIGDACNEIGITIAGGHTGSYPGGEFTVIGAGMMFGLARRDGYVAPSMARAGDTVLMTKHAAIEATGSLALTVRSYLEGRLGKRIVKRAGEMLRLCSTVRDAQTAKLVGLRKGITSMHDATEGGVLGALDEMASAAGKAFRVTETAIPVSKEAKAVCDEFELDPLRTMGEGALLITCRPQAVHGLLQRMKVAQIPVSEIGKVEKGRGLLVEHEGGKVTKYRPGPDRYWMAYKLAARRRLK